MNSVLLDTSFCIRLLKSNDPYHQHARDYFRYFLEKKVVIFLSTIVVAEYAVKDDAANLPLENAKIIPFDFFDAQTAGEFHSILISNKQQVADIERNVIKDDCKLIAQIYNRKIEGYITKDIKSFTKIIQPVTRFKGFKIELMDMQVPLNEYKGELF